VKRWHETLIARIALRLAGLGVLSLAWITGSDLYARVHAHPPAPASLSELALCAVLVLLLIVGNALVFVGAGLWKTVPLPANWSAARIDVRDFEVALFRNRK
jgi:hypothetical protein